MRLIFCLVDQKVCPAACKSTVASTFVSASEKILKWDLGVIKSTAMYWSRP